MSTYITVTSGTGALVTRVKQVQQANREAQLQRESDTVLEAQIATDLAEQAAQQQRPRGGNPDTSIERKPAAQRGGKLLPFAISWKGVFSGGHNESEVTVLRTFDVFGAGIRYDLITSTFSGGRTLTPSPVRFASGTALVSSQESSRLEAFNTNVVSCATSSSPDACNAPSYSLTTYFPGQWLTAARRYVGDPYIPVLDAPAVSLPVGVVQYMPQTAIVTVASDGTVYLVLSLPSAPVALTARTYQEFIDAGFPANTLITGFPVGIPYSAEYDPFTGLANRIYAPQVDSRYIFIKSKGPSMESKIASRGSSQSLGDFLDNNLYSSDPSRSVRKAGYFGEYRLRGSNAKFLQLNDGSDSYTGFPYDFLESYKDSGDLPLLAEGAGFDDFTYALQPYATPAELASQLAFLQVVGNATPIKKVRVKTDQALFAKAKERLGNDSGQQITPYLFLAVGQ